ncbi:MAG TPA: DUF72 domain-containing protein [Thermoanaerobaculia bacterium]|jgi:uncharacterized protein YecE (DUF72 family)
MAIEGYYLGCPSWGLKDWVGGLYHRDARASDYLAEYARVFNAVEGNTTFYSLPPETSVARWRQSTPEGFRFSFKLPRSITHEHALEGADAETTEFLERMAPLGERLGPFMIQLPPSFGPDRLEVLDRFLRRLPGGFHYAVELRHRGFYDSEHAMERANDVLALYGAERVVLDTRALASGDPGHPDVAAARRKKPHLPVEPIALGPHPLVRFVGHPDDAVNLPWMERWCRTLTRWIEHGRRPFVFVHCPNDAHSPRLARRLHAMLAESVAVGTMPPWPGEEDEDAEGQMRLF